VAQWQRAQTRARVLAFSTALSLAKQIEEKSFAEEPAADGPLLADEASAVAAGAVEVA